MTRSPRQLFSTVTADQPCGNYNMEWHTFDENAGATETHGNFTAVLEYTDCTWWRGDGEFDGEEEEEEEEDIESYDHRFDRHRRPTTPERWAAGYE